MKKLSLHATARNLSAAAANASSGRASETVYGGHANRLRQTVIALTEGSRLAPHESPGEATVIVLHGRVRLTTASDAWEGREGDLIVVPNETHGLEALSDASFMLTVATSG
jgi:quercetin dioxygenase-like cupin family protein